MRQLVSIVITTYNYGRFLSFALESAVRQTYEPKEVVVVDDGSIDDTESIIKPFLDKYSINYIKQDNQGQPRAKNMGISLAKGEFIAFLDADDIWQAEKLEKQMPLFRDPAVAVVYSGFVGIDVANAPIKGFRHYKFHRGWVTEKMLFENFVCFSSCIVRRRVLNEAGCFDESIPMGIDWDLWLRIAPKHKFDYVDEVLVKYRLGHPDQMSRNLEKRYIYGDKIKKKFFDRNPEFQHLWRKRWEKSYIDRAIVYLTRDRKASEYWFRKVREINPFPVNSQIRYLIARVKNELCKVAAYIARTLRF